MTGFLLCIFWVVLVTASLLICAANLSSKEYDR